MVKKVAVALAVKDVLVKVGRSYQTGGCILLILWLLLSVGS